MHKLTEAQRKALKLIAQYPGRVVAWQRGPRVKGYLTINGNVENAFSGSGLVKEVSTGIVLSTHVEDGETITSYLNTWEITDAGREAIRFPTVAGNSAKNTEAKRESVRQGWAKFHNTMDVMNKRPGSDSGSDSLRNMLTLH